MRSMTLPACQLAIETVQVAQRGKVTEREPHRIENRHLRGSEARRHLAGQQVGDLDDARRGVELLNLALDAGLGLELDHDARIGPSQNIRMQLRLARAIAADGVQVHAGFDHLRRQDQRIALVGSRRGHDIGAVHRFRDTRART